MLITKEQKINLKWRLYTRENPMTEYDKELLREQKKTNELLIKLNTRLWCVLVGVAAILIFVIRNS